MRKFVLLALLIAPALAAQTADVVLTSMDTNRGSYENGERFTLTMRWKNLGPDTAQDVVAELGGNGVFVVTGAGTSHWPCEPSPAAASFVCHGFLDPGAEANMVVTMRAPARGTSFDLVGSVRTTTFDPDTSNNTLRAPLQLTRPEATVSLAISPRAQTHHAPAGGRVSIPLTVRNSGSSTAENLVTLLSFAPGLLIPIEASGTGWSCQHTTHSPWTILCMRSSLGESMIAPITVTATAPQTEAVYEFSARVSAERAFDENGANDAATATLIVGTPVEPQEPVDPWKRILIPVLPAEVPGQNNARWKTETTIVTGGAGVEPALGTAGNGQFLYVRASEEARVHINSRVWDLSRATETAGSEVPVVRERDFRSSAIALIGIPVAPHYRHTLRVYDLDGRNGARVAIRLYANGETTPRATVTQTLTLFSDATATPDRLPVFPAYLQLDPATLASIADASTMRIEVEPLDEGVKLWAFVSVTNNETHHVTTFSAQ